MKKIISRIQSFGDKAAQFKAAVQSVPPKVAEIREAVTLTAGQLHQLRSDIQTSFTGLRVNDDERLTVALREINDHTETFARAGFHLAGVDMDLGINRRLIVHLEKVDDVSQSNLRSILTANQGRETIRALFEAILQAEQLAGKMELSHLNYHKLIVDVGLAPSIQICWQSDTMVVEEEPTAPAHVATPPLPASAPTESSIFGQSSFFERRSEPPARESAPTSKQSRVELSSSEPPTPVPQKAEWPVTESPAASTQSAKSLGGGDWRRSALDRFKKMPDLTKASR